MTVLPIPRRQPRGPTIIIAPPLTGCSTLAGFIRQDGFVLDCDRHPGFQPHGKSLTERKGALLSLVDSLNPNTVVCLPALPSSELVPLVQTVVIIPASLFMRRLLAIPQSKYADGHRVAALQWRDEAIQLAATYRLPTVSAINQTPALSALRIGQ